MENLSFEEGKYRARELNDFYEDLLEHYGFEIDEATTAQELNDYLQEYNWDDGFAIPYLIICHPNCELATAVGAFWLAEGQNYFEKDFKKKETKGFMQNWKEFIIFLTEHILKGDYIAGNLPFPEKWALTKEQKQKRKMEKTKRSDIIPDIFYGLGAAWK